MLGWLYRTLVGSFSSCNHKWKIIEHHKISDHGGACYIGDSRTLQCEHCGNVKNIKYYN